MKIAMKFKISSSINRTRIVLAARSWKDSFGCLDQKKICMGRARKPSITPVGVVFENRLATNKIGAVSPSALATDRIAPVAIPGIAFGRTWCLTACHRVAPTPNAASLNDLGTAKRASSVVTTIIGRTIIARVREPVSKLSPKPNILLKT